MDIAEAIKKARAEKPRENYMIFEFSYDNRLLLPHRDGVTLLSALANAEKLYDRYGEPKRIVELGRDQITTKTMSYQEYERYKLAALLQITPDEVKEAMEAMNKPPQPATT